MDQHHITDQELLLQADSELGMVRAAIVRNHLSACWACRVRKAELETTIAGFVQAHYNKLDEQLPPMDGPRALLLARMAQEGPGSLPFHWHLHPALVSVVLLAVLICGLMFWKSGRVLHYQGPAPVAALTPGAIQPISIGAMCAAVDDDQQTQVDAALAQTVFDRYGITNPKPRAYEVDFLIPPSLGGSSDPRNLWPQPYEAGVWNARIKDALEDRLRMLVCEKRLDLATAQADLADNWITAYKKYFRTDTPLVHHLAFVKDRPWE